MAWILLRPSNYKQVDPLVRTGGSRRTELAALPHHNIHAFQKVVNFKKFWDYNPKIIDNFVCLRYANLKNLEGWYDYGDSTERISG